MKALALMKRSRRKFLILFIVACRPIDFLLNSDKIYLEFINIRVGNVMVTFRLIDENIRYIIYWYFPEGNEEKGNGRLQTQ